jgi:hypothetical protein
LAVLLALAVLAVLVVLVVVINAAVLLQYIETGEGWVSSATLVTRDFVSRFVQDISAAVDESVNQAVRKSIESVAGEYLREVE